MAGAYAKTSSINYITAEITSDVCVCVFISAGLYASHLVCISKFVCIVLYFGFYAVYSTECVAGKDFAVYFYLHSL